jgi:hypothetical protein
MFTLEELENLFIKNLQLDFSGLFLLFQKTDHRLDLL